MPEYESVSEEKGGEEVEKEEEEEEEEEVKGQNVQGTAYLAEVTLPLAMRVKD